MSIITIINHTEITKRYFLTKFPNLQTEKRILIVEDETLLALGMEHTLTDFGYSVCEIASCAKDAIAYAHCYHPHVILMDIRLKGEQSGIDAANIIWQELQIPIVFLTSYCDDATLSTAMESEPYGYLIKPCRDSELKVSIETALKKHQLFDTFEQHKKHFSKVIQCVNKYSYDKSRNLLFNHNEMVKLTGKETRFFDILSDYPGQPISFERICDYVWDDGYMDISKLRTLVYRIKNKVGKELIENVYELGYKLKLDE